MKQLTILLFILHISLLTSCQNKSEADDAPYTFYLDEKEYSYKGYEIISGTRESRVFPLAIGESGLIYYFAYKPGMKMDLDQTGYKLDSITLQRVENIWDKDSLDYSTRLVFDKELPIDKIADITFLLKGFKQYNRQYQELSTENAEVKEFSDKDIEFSNKGYQFKLLLDFKEDKENKKIVSDYSAILQIGDKKQCIFKSPDKLNLRDVFMCSIGDLDGDGEIDFVLRVDDDQEEATYIYFLLYLSSEAEEGDLVKHVATGLVRQTLKLLEGPIGIKGGDIEIRH